MVGWEVDWMDYVYPKCRFWVHIHFNVYPKGRFRVYVLIV